VTWAPSTLPPKLMQRGGNPAVLGRELLGIIGTAIENQPRSQQRLIGPSEIGHPCPRRLGYKLLDAPEFNTHQGVPWKPFIGTCVHTELGNIFDRHNLAYSSKVSPGDERWYVETKVGNVGQVGPDEIDGSCDLYDRVTATVVDWKIVGPAPLKSYRASGPGSQYRSQAHLYGRGWSRHHGLPVDTVMIAFLPRNDELDKAHVWFEPYDEQVALDALARVNAIHAATSALGRKALALLPTADAYCYRCDYYTPDSTNPLEGCPGHAERSLPKPALTLEGKQ
jgi:hypothetical protein